MIHLYLSLILYFLLHIEFNVEHKKWIIKSMLSLFGLQINFWDTSYLQLSSSHVNFTPVNKKLHVASFVKFLGLSYNCDGCRSLSKTKGTHVECMELGKQTKSSCRYHPGEKKEWLVVQSNKMNKRNRWVQKCIV